MKRFLQSLQGVLIFFFSLQIKAQHPVYYAINDEQGLPSNEVYKVLQDKFGYMWIGCDAGLFRYDGFEFKPYRAAGQNGRSISGLALDKKGRVWCRNFNGQIYIVKDDSLYTVIDLKETHSVNTAFSLDEKSNAWLFKNNTIVQVNDEGKELVAVTVYSQPEKSYALQSILYKDGLVYYFITGKGAFVMKDGKSKCLSNTIPHELLTLVSIYDAKPQPVFLFHKPGGDYALASLQDGQLHLDRLFKKEELTTRINGISVDHTGKQWICTSAGVFDCAEYNGKQPGNKLFPDHKISSVLKDREGSYWFTTLDQGIFVCPSMDIIRYSSGNTQIPENNLTALAALTDSTIVVGSHTGKVVLLNVSNGGVTVCNTRNNISTISTKKIINSNGHVLISHGALGELLPDGKIDSYSLFNARDLFLKGDSLYFITPEIAGLVALADLKKNKAITYNELRRKGGRVLTLSERDGVLYCLFNDGLYYFKNDKWLPVLYKSETFFGNGMAIQHDTLWVATIDKGIIAVRNGEVVKEINKSNGFRENEMRCIAVNGNYIWAGGNLALYRISIADHSYIELKADAGICPQDITAIAFAGTDVCLATNRGLLKIPQEINWKNPIVPSIEIQSVVVNGTEKSYSGNLILPFNNTNVTILLSSVALKSRGKYEYYYRLTGLDSSWKSLNASVKEIVFSSLPPGDFVFEVKAVNESNVFSKIIHLPVKVEFPVWQKWWFYLIGLFVIVVVLVIVFIFRIRYVKAKAETAMQLTASQLSAINAQMNPHFLYNTLNSIQDLILKSDIKNTNYYLSRFSSLMRKVLDASQHNTIQLDEEIEILQLYLSLEKLRFGDDFIYNVNCDKEIKTSDIEIPSLIIQPFVENAIKHGLLHKRGEKMLSIDFFLEKDLLVCRISDNGIGRKRSAEIKERAGFAHKSFATKATEKRLALINENRSLPILLQIIDLADGITAVGTEVVLTIPLSNS